MVPNAVVPESGVMDATVAALGALVAAALALAISGVRMVPAAHRGVVLRAGRVRRSTGPGPALVLPLIERIEMVAMHPRALAPVTVNALTRDGVAVRLVVDVLWLITHPSLAVLAVPDAAATTEDAVERALHHLVANIDLPTLLRDRDPLTSRLPVTVSALAGHSGVEIIDVDILDVEVRVGPELLRLLA